MSDVSVDVEKLRESMVRTFYFSDSNSDTCRYIREKHSKLSYRRDILKRELDSLKLKSKEVSVDVMILVKSLFSKAYSKLGLDLHCEPTIQFGGKNGDFQCTDAFSIYKKMNKHTPKIIAEEIVGSLPSNIVIKEVFVSNGGFININVSERYCSEFLTDLILNMNKKEFNCVKPPGYIPKNVVVDFSSPNIAKQMHVGHLRSTIIGDCICRLFEYLNCDVSRVNHVGDWGTQFGMLIAFMEQQTGSLKNLPSIGDLQEFYKQSKVAFDGNASFKKAAHNMVVKLQRGDPDVRKAWEMICDISRKEFDMIYKRLNIKIKEMGESFYQPLMPDVVQEFEAKNIITEEEGCKIVLLKELNIPPLFVVKSDGGFTYDTSDLATLKYRLDKMNADCIFYVVDNGQASHFDGIFHAGKVAGWYADIPYKRVEHVGFGVVLGSDKKKFKTRSGDTVKLATLLDEGVSRAKEKLKNRAASNGWSEDEIQNVSETLAYACIKYSDLSHNRNSDYAFSYDHMLDDRGNTAVYLFYALTRMKSIIRKSGIDYSSIKNHLDIRTELEDLSVIFEHPSELALAKKIIIYPTIIKRMVEDLMPHKLCDYSFELATLFMEFYESCYCFSKDGDNITSVNMHRISIVYASKMVLESSLSILGIDSSIDKM